MENYQSVGDIMREQNVDIETARKIRNGEIAPKTPVAVPKVKTPSLGQIDTLIYTLNQLGGIKEHWDLSLGRLKLYSISIKQFEYLKILRNEKKLTKINQVLESLNIPRK